MRQRNRQPGRETQSDRQRRRGRDPTLPSAAVISLRLSLPVSTGLSLSPGEGCSAGPSGAGLGLGIDRDGKRKWPLSPNQRVSPPPGTVSPSANRCSGLLTKLWVKELINAGEPGSRHSVSRQEETPQAVLPAPPPCRGALRPPPQRPQPRGHSPRLPPNFSALGSRSWTQGFPILVPPRASPWTRREQSSSPRPSLALQPFRGGALHAPGSSRGSPAPRLPFYLAFTWI